MLDLRGDVVRRGRREVGPQTGRQVEVARRDGPGALDEAEDRVGSLRPEEIVGLHELDATGPFGRRKKRENLDQLELIVEIMLEPQLDRVEIGVPLHDRVALGELGFDLGLRDVEAAGEKRHAPPRARAKLGLGDRPFVQHVAPGQDDVIPPRRVEQLRGAIAVGDDQSRHGSRPWPGRAALSRRSGRPPLFRATVASCRSGAKSSRQGASRERHDRDRRHRRTGNPRQPRQSDRGGRRVAGGRLAWARAACRPGPRPARMRRWSFATATRAATAARASKTRSPRSTAKSSTRSAEWMPRRRSTSTRR